jgi:hypothetical protein
MILINVYLKIVFKGCALRMHHYQQIEEWNVLDTTRLSLGQSRAKHLNRITRFPIFVNSVIRRICYHYIAQKRDEWFPDDPHIRPGEWFGSLIQWLDKSKCDSLIFRWIKAVPKKKALATKPISKQPVERQTRLIRSDRKQFRSGPCSNQRNYWAKALPVHNPILIWGSSNSSGRSMLWSIQYWMK